MRRPPVVLGMAAIMTLALMVAVGLILFQVNPTQQSNERNLNAQQRELATQVRDLNAIICSQAQTTANAYRFRSLTPAGRAEPIRHFLTRMQAQRQTLELSLGRKCEVAPGFPPFEFQLKRALRQIEGILSSFSAKQREPVRRGISILPGFTDLTPNGHKIGKVGIGEEGIPFLPPRDGVSPGSPRQRPPKGSSPESTPPPASSPQTPVTPVSPPPDDEEPSKPELADLPTLPDLPGEEALCTAVRQVNGLC